MLQSDEANFYDFLNSIFQLALSTFAAFKLAGVKLRVHFECVEINEGEDIQGATHLRLSYYA